MSHIDEQCYLFASNLENPEYFFQGYCFYNNDYIFGIDGANSYYNQTGYKIRGGEDGCYVAVERISNDYYFNNDFSGFKKIFYYNNNGLWVVSNSLVVIANHLKKSGVRLRVNYSQLAAIGVHKGMLFNQLYSHFTFIEGVKLVPLNHTLKISSVSCSVTPIQNEIGKLSYPDSISTFISTWLARFGALLLSGITIRSDLTGGCDSRVVFALLKVAADLFGSKENHLILNCGSTIDNRKDLIIAESIANAYDIPINTKVNVDINRISSIESFKSWKNLCLGVYHPIYFPNFGPQGNIVGLGGAGPGGYRPVYKYKSIEGFISDNSNKLHYDFLRYNFKADLFEEIEFIRSLDSKLDPFILHYKYFRNRMHSGRSPQYQTFFQPLASKLLSNAAAVAGTDRILNGQINYDIMHSVLPEVLKFDFDHPSKELNEVRRLGLSKVNYKINGLPGKCYVGRGGNEKKLSGGNVFFELRNDFRENKDKKFVIDFFGSKFIGETEAILDIAVENKRFRHAVDGQGVAAIIAGGLFE